MYGVVLKISFECDKSRPNLKFWLRIIPVQNTFGGPSLVFFANTFQWVEFEDIVVSFGISLVPGIELATSRVKRCNADHCAAVKSIMCVTSSYIDVQCA